MANGDPKPAEASAPEPKLKIYFLPNLMTAGNLFCGFIALTKIVEADASMPNFTSVIRVALFYILLACIFDLLDGRVARLGGHESPFGREFDSLADIVSFGVAPAFLVHRIVLADVFRARPEIGWFIALIYLICGAFRLARFNCLAVQAGNGGGKEFLGFPIPAAAGLVGSLTLFLLWTEDHDYRKFQDSTWRFLLPGIMVILSMMMVSQVKYPTFKKLDFRTTRTFPKMVGTVLLVGFFVLLWDKILQFVLPLVFTAYLLYGFIRPRISRKIRADIEEEGEEEEDGSGEP
jgi:CDP-diacylglycerol--serine O-phosphatidyltransferase